MYGNIITGLVAGSMAAALVSYLIGRKSKKVRDYFVMAVTAAEFAVMAGLLLSGGQGGLSLPGVCGMGLSFRLDGFRKVFALVTSYMWMMTTFFSREYLGHARNRNRYHVFLLLTLGAVMGVFLSDDLFTTFVFFEMMSMASYVCVVHEEKRETMEAGGVYLAIAVIGGIVTLMGMLLLYHQTGTLVFSELREAAPILAETPAKCYVSGALILFGFGAKAGMYPLHVWLPMAHPVAPAPASALLSGIITKTGIFGVLVLTADLFFHDGAWGFVMLLLGVLTMLCGGILAIFSVDLKRTLACSSMSQLGFLFVGIGMQGLLGEENALAVRGTILHMFNHSNLKLVLFMAAGVVVMNLHKLELNEIRGFGRKKPLLAYVFLMGSLGIGGIPLWNGYVSKTLIHESIVEYIELLEEGHGAEIITAVAGADAHTLFKVIEWLFIITGAMTVAYMMKLFVVLFVEKNCDAGRQAAFDRNKNYMNKLTASVLAISASILPVLGCLPAMTLDRIADLGQGFLQGASPEHAVHYFSLVNLKGGVYSIVIGTVIYLLVIRRGMLVEQEDKTTRYVDRWPKQMDLLELVYKPLTLVLIPSILGFACRCMDQALDRFISLMQKSVYRPFYSRRKAEAGFWIAFAAGSFCNAAAAFMNRTIYRKHPGRRDYIEVFTKRERTFRQVNKMVTASASFSLLMFGIGLVVMVVYLLSQGRT